jgi:glucose uptake protein GlcU
MSFGFLAAFVCSIFFSLYIVPKKLSRQTPLFYVLFVGVGFTLIAIISYLINGLVNSFDNPLQPTIILPAAVGINWTIGLVLFTSAIDKIGLTRSNQWKNLQGPIGALLCLFVLGEWEQIRLEFVVLAVVAITTSAYLFTMKKSGEQQVNKKSVWLAIASACLFGLSAMLQKMAVDDGLSIWTQLCWIAIAMFISALTIVLFRLKSLRVLQKVPKKDVWLGIISGAILFLATLTYIISNYTIPASVAYTIMQFNAVWTILIGVLIFKEIDYRKNWLRLLVGLVLAIASIVLLLFARL